MKASELIKQLEDAISKYGDKEVIMEYPICHLEGCWTYIDAVHLTTKETDYDTSEETEFIELY